MTEAGVVNFENIAEIKKKAVRGLLKKRAKKYDSDNSADSDGDQELKKKKKVQKDSLGDAFKSIMNKKITESGEYADTAILSRYKRPAAIVQEEKEKEDVEMKKRIAKEKQRLMGRLMPTRLEHEYERELAIIATRGVI
jgi:hypothetical protein